MSEWVQPVIGIVVGMLLLWAVLVLALWREYRRHSEAVKLRQLLRIAPDVVRLLRRLAADPTVPRGVRVWLVVLLAYLLSPIDLIPDFIPVLGYADDAIVIVVALRYATRRGGREAVTRNWPGTPEGLSTVLRLAGLDA
ncbi:MAG: hypothetical protein JWO01_2699 [Microbacteriaceae bacterium]|jgi:uncharacterized membrane protein YkvA (DUF1232 family)|nr:hypothetical protein [Microbacteriaceae bacterium]MDQ1607055.1 hypothetical protein [Microbacteriaceae bacterium]